MTNAIHHHPNEETLIAYAAGNLTGGHSLILATHFALCPKCRDQVAHYEDIGGAAFMQYEGIAVSDGVLQDIMAQLDNDAIMSDPPSSTSRASAPSENLHVINPAYRAIPQPLRDMLPASLEDLEWRSMAPGIKHYPLPVEGNKDNKGTTRLLKIAPGTSLPEHEHRGSELTLVLKGAFSDEVGRFKVGDVADFDSDTRHQPIADTHEDCICLIATDAPLKFTGLVPRMLQSIIGI